MVVLQRRDVCTKIEIQDIVGHLWETQVGTVSGISSK